MATCRGANSHSFSEIFGRGSEPRVRLASRGCLKSFEAVGSASRRSTFYLLLWQPVRLSLGPSHEPFGWSLGASIGSLDTLYFILPVKIIFTNFRIHLTL